MSEDNKIYSFDIFDTTLTRSVAQPKDIFILIQDQLIERSCHLPEGLLNGFHKARSDSEKQARHLSKTEEICLEDIYQQLKKAYDLNAEQIKSLISIEREIELQSTYPIAWTVSHIQRLRKERKKIIFISDMYLPLNHIKAILQKVHAYENGDPIYLSSEIGLRKSSGRLYQYVWEKENCRPHDIEHIGNNHYSDLYVPSKLGITISPFAELKALNLLTVLKFSLRRALSQKPQ